MRVVIDTNVLVSAAIKHNSPPEAVIHVVRVRRTLLTSTATSAEFHRTISRPRLARVIDPTVHDAVLDLMAAAESILITEHIAACRDPKDDKFLELAVNGRADVIVTGDADLLALHPFRGIPIETPAAFLRRTGQS
jgi:putative PIN family toxin of toxin-antitoxin system